MIKSDITKNLRAIQAKRIRDKNETCSFSKIVNETLEFGLK